MNSERRIKKRHIVLAVALLVVMLIGAAIWDASTARPGPLVNYHEKLHALARDVQGPGPDRWSTFTEVLAAASAAQEVIEAHETAELGTGWRDYPVDAVYGPGDGDRDEFAALQARGQAWIESFASQGLFEQTAHLSGVEVAIRPMAEGRLIDILLPYLGETRNLARIQAARMHLASERGDWEDYTAAVEELLASARIVASQTTLIDYLVGLAVEGVVFAELRKDIVAGLIDDVAVLERLLAAMDRHRLPNMAHAFESERMSQLDIIQRVYTDNGRGDGRLLLTEWADFMTMTGAARPKVAEYRIINTAGIVFPTRAETVADMNRLFDPMIAEVKIPAHQRVARFDVNQFVDSLPRLQMLLAILTPALDRALSTADQLNTIRSGTELLLRIERHRLRSGAPPATLADLAAADPQADLIDPMTGDPFLYTLLTDDPAGRPYLLYAAGADGQDDGGIEHEDRAERAFQQTGAGTDYVLNPPPQAPDWDEP